MEDGCMAMIACLTLQQSKLLISFIVILALGRVHTYIDSYMHLTRSVQLAWRCMTVWVWKQRTGI
jgi:hypothetical protein